MGIGYYAVHCLPQRWPGGCQLLPGIVGPLHLCGYFGWGLLLPPTISEQSQYVPLQQLSPEEPFDTESHDTHILTILSITHLLLYLPGGCQLQPGLVGPLHLCGLPCWLQTQEYSLPAELKLISIELEL